MSKNVSSSISKKSKWWISDNRHMELRYFCRQYKEWQSQVNMVFARSASIVERRPDGGDISKTVEEDVFKHEKLRLNMRIIEEASIHTDPDLAVWIFKAVTEGYKYEYLRGILDIPCGRRQYYEKLRKFYWVLDKMLVEASR